MLAPHLEDDPGMEIAAIVVGGWLLASLATSAVLALLFAGAKLGPDYS